MTRCFGLHPAAIVVLTVGVVTGVHGWANREPLASTADLVASVRAGGPCRLNQAQGTPGVVRSRYVKGPAAVMAAVARLPADARLVRRPGRGGGYDYPDGEVTAHFPDALLSLTVRYDGAVARVGTVTYDIRDVPPAAFAELYRSLASEAGRP